MSYSLDSIDTFPHRDVYTVSRLNLEVKDLLEAEFGFVWIEGEISNVAKPASGHLYFTLKDQRSEVSCAMFQRQNRLLRFSLENGIQVLARAKVGLFPARGRFQLIVEHMEESGEGALRRAFDALKQRLSNEGLFDPAHKKPLPVLARRIGIITSPSGAAIRDILSVHQRRFPAIPIVIYPVPVQGPGAGKAIARMIAQASERAECDVLILSRGGGSLEDLWAFNEEVVARAIHRCAIPLVSGIGHEIDFTIADFVADHRAPTPSAAAELTTPNRQEWRQRFVDLANRLSASLHTQMKTRGERLQWVQRRLMHPKRRLQDMAQRADEGFLRLQRSVENVLTHKQAQLAVLFARLNRHAPDVVLHTHRQHWQTLTRRLQIAIQQTLKQQQASLSSIRRAFEAVSPQQTLERGYAIITHQQTGEILRSSAAIKPGQQIRARLAKGSITGTIDDTHD